MTFVKNCLRFGCAFLFGMILLTGCSGSDERDAKTAASAMINENEKIVAFGHVSIQQLLDKMDYKNLPKVSALLGGELPAWQKGVDLSKPVFFAIEAPFTEERGPNAAYIFLDVKNKDSLMDKFSEMGYQMEKAGEIDCFRENDVAVGVRNELAIILIKGGEFDHKALLETAFEQTEGDESKGKTADILDTKGDMVGGWNIERLYTTSNTSLNKLSADKKKELEELVDDAFVKGSVTFENGKVTMKYENLFSEKLKDRLFFKEDASASIVQKLGSGNAWMGVSGNIDIRKMEAFLNDFAPEAAAKMTEKLPGELSFATAMMGDNPLGKMFSGQFGMVMTGTPNSATGMVPEFNLFLGLGSQGDMINNFIREYATMSGFLKQGDAYVTDGTAIAPRADGLYVYKVNTTGGSLKIPGFAKDFGKKTFTVFVDFGQIDVKSLELEGATTVVEILDTFYLTADRNGAEVVMTSKDQSSNILKQAALHYTKMLEERMGGLSL